MAARSRLLCWNQPDSEDRIAPIQPKKSAMKQNLPVSAILICAALLVSCKRSSEQPTDRPVGPAPAPATSTAVRDTAQAIQEDARDAADEIQDFTYEQRANYIAALRLKVDALKRRLEALSDSIEKSSDIVKADSRPRMAALRERLAQLERQVQAAQEAAPDTWDRVKADVRKTYGEVKEGFRDARQWASDKLAP
jgi:polyhydroxyalkanoate synthesis regulator phasin